MAHSIPPRINFDMMAAQMIGNVYIPVNPISNVVFGAIQSLCQALIDLGYNARNLATGGVDSITNYQYNGDDEQSTAQVNTTQIPINGEVGGIITNVDENGNYFRVVWKAYYL